MSRPWILVTPSSRGIGKALTTHLLKTTPLPILATTRRDPKDTKESLLSAASAPSSAADRLHVVTLDVTDEDAIASASSHAATLFPPKTHHLHLALAIPGILHPEKNPAQVDYAKALDTYKVNTLGPLLLMKHFYEFLPRNSTSIQLSPEVAAEADGAEDVAAKKRGEQGEEGHAAQQRQVPYLPDHATWLSMSARVGSVSDNRAGGWYSYRSSKTAVTSLAKSFDNYLRARSGDKAIAMAYHPGTTKTDLSKGFWDSVPKESLLEPDFAAQRLLEVVAGLDREKGRGKLWDWKHTEILP